MTYSIVAFDREANQWGVAVQTHPLSVGAWVPWLQPGVGAIATQASTNVGFGPLGLQLLAGGLSAQQTLAALLATDSDAARRQVAVLDRTGNVATHTGERCIPFAAHRQGAAYSVQANMMLKDTVPDVMVHAFETTPGALAERLMATLEAAEAEGGDIRGMGSAGLIVVDGDHGAAWQHTVCNLRVDQADQPLVALRRLVAQHQATLIYRTGHAQLLAGDWQAAIDSFTAARDHAPDATEMQYWQAIALAAQPAAHPEARRLLADLLAHEPQWHALTERMLAYQLFEQPTAVAELLTSVDQGGL